MYLLGCLMTNKQPAKLKKKKKGRIRTLEENFFSKKISSPESLSQIDATEMVKGSYLRVHSYPTT